MTDFKRLPVFAASICFGLSLMACSTLAPPPGRTPSRLPPYELERPSEPAPPRPPEVTVPERPAPRAVAALQLTEQGRSLLAEGKRDEAISVLERAVSLNPTGGKNYYYLAEAWLAKKNISQAAEFNHLAEIYMKGDTGWMDRVAAQRERIERTKR